MKNAGYAAFGNRRGVGISQSWWRLYILSLGAGRTGTLDAGRRGGASRGRRAAGVQRSIALTVTDYPGSAGSRPALQPLCARAADRSQ